MQQAAAAPLNSTGRSGFISPNVTTAPPSPGSPVVHRQVFGYVNAGNLGDTTVGFTSWHLQDLTTVAFFGLHVNSGDGALVRDSNWNVWTSSVLTSFVQAARANGVKVVVSIILQEPPGPPGSMCVGLQHAATTITQTIDQVNAQLVDGVNIDYEGSEQTCGAETNSSLLVKLVTGFRNQLPPTRNNLTVATYASSAGQPGGFFNIPLLAPQVDAFFVMAYDLDVSNVPPGCSDYCLSPVAPLNGYRWNDAGIASDYTRVAPPGKVILGVPYYGRKACVNTNPPAAAPPGPNQAPIRINNASTWASSTYLDSASASSEPSVTRYLARQDPLDPGGNVRWDTWYSTTWGCWREAYWDDAAALGAKYNLVNSANLAGVGIFALDYGGGAPELWDRLNTYFAAQSLDGYSTSTPAIASWAPGRLDVVAQGSDGALWHKYWAGSTWSAWESLGGGISDSPAAASWASGRLDVFVRGTDNALWHRYWGGSGWTAWESLGGQLTSGPRVASSGPGHLDVTVRGSDLAVWTTSFASGSWTPWRSLGGSIKGSPAAASWGPGRLDVFVRGTDDQAWHRWTDGAGWSSWEPLGGSLTAEPTASSFAFGELDLSVLGTDHGLWQRRWQPGWTGWTSLGGQWSSAPSAVSQPGVRSIDVVAAGAGSAIYHISLGPY